MAEAIEVVLMLVGCAAIITFAAIGVHTIFVGGER